MKKYKFEVIIEEGNDEFWEELNREGKTGCDDVLHEMQCAFDAAGWEPKIKLVEYTDA